MFLVKDLIPVTKNDNIVHLTAIIKAKDVLKKTFTDYSPTLIYETDISDLREIWSLLSYNAMLNTIR